MNRLLRRAAGGRRLRSLGIGVAVALAHLLSPPTAEALFTYEPIADPITSATFSIDTAELTAHRTLFGTEVNEVLLIDVSGGLGALDLSDDLFGNTAAFSDAALIDQGAGVTGLVSVAIAASFFPALAGGEVGLSVTLTDTSDGVFAIDTLVLAITTASSTTTAYFGAPVDNPNDGFGLGLADGAALPGPLPGSLNATGTGFDEPISGLSLNKVPEPDGLTLLALGLLALGLRRR